MGEVLRVSVSLFRGHFETKQAFLNNLPPWGIILSKT